MKSNAHIEGTGLGLAIVKSIVDSMKGEFGVESEYGVGSEFWVKLPVQCIDSELLGSDFMEKRNSSITYENSCTFTAPEAKILAVDDNQSNLTIVKLFLKKNGIVPDLCSTGTRAIELCKEKKYDLMMVMITNVLKEGTELLFVGDPDTIRAAFNVEDIHDHHVFLPHVLSRKKQIVPALSQLWG